jgi:hypothetical protein
MDLLHHVYGLLLGGELHSAPIGKSPQRVLDLGTGTGMSEIDFTAEGRLLIISQVSGRLILRSKWLKLIGDSLDMG